MTKPDFTIYRESDRREARSLYAELKHNPTSVQSRVRLYELRLLAVYDVLPPRQFATAAGLIVQAARLRVQLDDLAADIAENGLAELFRQSVNVEPYQRERPAASLFGKLDKNYQAIMRQLSDLLPNEPPAAGSGSPLQWEPTDA